MVMATISTNSIGMVTFENFSIPLRTPPRMMPAVRAMKMVWATTGSQVEEMKREKKPVIFSGGTPVKSKARALKRYSTLHPPTTE